MLVTNLLSIFFFHILYVSAAAETPKIKSLVSLQTLSHIKSFEESIFESMLNSFYKNEHDLNAKKIKSLKGVFEFLEMDQEYRVLLSKVLIKNHCYVLKPISDDKNFDSVKQQFLNASFDVLDNIFSKNVSICNFEDFFICQNQYFTSFNLTQKSFECNYLTHIFTCASKTCSQSAFAVETIRNLTHVCSSSKKETNLSFSKKNAMVFIKNFDKNKLVKNIKLQTKHLSVDSLPKTLNNGVDSNLYYKNHKLKEISTECIIPHFKPKFNLNSCNKRKISICKEALIAELVLTRVHLCPNCENKNEYDTCICKCCIAKELMNLCYKTNCDDEIELSRYHRYIEDTCQIKPFIVVDDNKSNDKILETTLKNTLNSLDISDKSAKLNLSENTEYNINPKDFNNSQFGKSLYNVKKMKSSPNLNETKIEVKNESVETFVIKTPKRMNQNMQPLKEQYLNNKLEEKILEDTDIDSQNAEGSNNSVIIYSQEDLEELEANGCFPYEITGECYHEHCCYPPKATTKTVYDKTTETDLIYSTILRYKIDSKTITETQLLENTITIQVPKTTVTTTKYQKKIVPKFKKTITLTTTQISVSTLTVTAAVASVVDNYLTKFETLPQIPARRPNIPHLIGIFGSAEDKTLTNKYAQNTTAGHYNKKTIIEMLKNNVTCSMQNSTFDSSTFTTKNKNLSDTKNSSMHRTFKSLGKINKTNKAGIVVSFITIALAYLLTAKNLFESNWIIKEADIPAGDILQNASNIEKRGVSAESSNANYEDDNEEFSFVKDELNRLSMNLQSGLTDNEVLQSLVSEEF